MDYDLDEFLEEYDDNTQQLANAGHSFFPQRLSQWFHLIDEGDELISKHVKALERQIDWETEVDRLMAEGGPMVGSGRINLPPQKLKRLSAYLNIMRRLQNGEIDLLNFAHDYFYDGRRIDDSIAKMADQFFEPFASELRRFIEKSFDTEIDDDETGPTDIDAIPASDRVVSINHNAPEYAALMTGLEGLEEQIQTTNHVDVQTKERSLAELRSVRAVLEPTTAREIVLKNVVLVTFSFLAVLFAETLIGQVIQTTIMPTLKALLPTLFGA